MYVDGTLVWGTEPDGTTPEDVQPATTTTGNETVTTTTTTVSDSTDYLYGDADDNGVISVSDIVAVLQYAVNKEKYPLTDRGVIQADVDGSAGVTAKDAFVIQQKDADPTLVIPLKN